MGLPGHWGRHGWLPSAGHDLVLLHYRACGPQGEPAVGHSDQKNDYQLATLAPNFAAFVRGLRPKSDFEP